MATEHFDWSGYPEIMAWFEKMKGEIPNYEKANGAGVAAFAGFFKKMTAKESHGFMRLKELAMFNMPN